MYAAFALLTLSHGIASCDMVPPGEDVIQSPLGSAIPAWKTHVHSYAASPLDTTSTLTMQATWLPRSSSVVAAHKNDPENDYSDRNNGELYKDMPLQHATSTS